LGPKKPDPFEDEAEVVAGSGEDGVDGIAVAVGEVIAVHTVTVLEVTDDRCQRRSKNTPLAGVKVHHWPERKYTIMAASN